MIANLVLFGASGDLGGRLLLPALATLRAQGRLPNGLAIACTAHEPSDDAEFRRHVAACLAEHAPDVPDEARDALIRSLRCRPADATDMDDVGRVMRLARPGAVAACLALPPRLFGATVNALGAAGLPHGSRIALEKPFGEDFADALALNQVVGDLFAEQAIFRVDHALGMATVQNLVALRRRDPVLAAVWDAEHIEQVEVYWEEDLALEGRAGYYDTAGALKDVVQNHMLQVLCVLAMEPPAGAEEHVLHDAKVAVLRAARVKESRRARYTAGRKGDREVPSYVEEEGVDPGRDTETFAEVVLSIDTPRWHGVRLVLRAGKALGARRREAVVRFRVGDVSSSLRVGIDGPSDMALELVGQGAISLVGGAPASDVPPYGAVLLELLEGGSALSVRADEAEEAWRVVEPVLTAWRERRTPLEEYPAGSAGPRRWSEAPHARRVGGVATRAAG